MRKPLGKALLPALLLGFCLVCSSSLAAEYFVDSKPATQLFASWGSRENPYSSIQEAVDKSRAGDTIYIREGTYTHTDKNRTFVHVTTSGTASAPITIQNYGSEHVVLMGRGFEDRDLNGDGRADGPVGLTNECLLRIEADYIHVRGLAFTNSNRWAVYLKGDHNRVENCTTHDNWDAGVTIDGNANVVSHVEAHHNRHMSGVIIRPSGSDRTASGNTIADSFLHNNGYQADGGRVLPALGDPTGGGNADGFTVFKGCNDTAPAGQNWCNDNTVIGNIAWHNSDDGFDASFANSLIKDNISIDNSSPRNGPNGYKTLRDVKNLVFINNITYHDREGFSLRVLGGTFLHNLAVDTREGLGFWLKFPETIVAFKNNMSAFSKKGDIRTITDCPPERCATNWTMDGSGGKNLSGDPQLVNKNLFKDAEGDITIQLPSGLSIAEKVGWLQKTVREAFTPAPTSPARVVGTPVSYPNSQTQQLGTTPFPKAASNTSSVEAAPFSPNAPTNLQAR